MSSSMAPKLTYLIVLAVLPMILPTIAAAAAFRGRALRAQFGLRVLFVLLTIAAISFGVGRLQILWQLKLTILWTLWLCLLAWVKWSAKFAPRR